VPATDASTHASRIFISYRRDDSELAASRLADDLCRQFTREQVFQDFASIDPGADFVDAVQRGLDTCAAVLVVIGPQWLNIVDRKGRRRLDVPGDWVRHEVAESPRRPGVRVFPLLLGDAQMPDVEDLPEDLQALTRRQAFPLTVRHWAKDVAELIGHLQRVPGLDRTSSPVDPDHPPVPSPSTTPAESVASTCRRDRHLSGPARRRLGQIEGRRARTTRGYESFATQPICPKWWSSRQAAS
jgi:hypothetical protein